MTPPTEIVLEGTFPVIEEEETGWTVEVHTGSGDALYLQGFPISGTDPVAGQGLIYTGGAWTPGDIGSQAQIDQIESDLAAHVANVANPHGVTAAQVGAYTTAQTDTAIAAHATRTDNPHAVTKAQVGLGSVENTALSTWAGSTNLTTLGTISTGTWNATAIAWAKVDKTGSSLADLATRSASDLSSGNLPYAQLPTGSGTWDVGSGNTITLPRHLELTGDLRIGHPTGLDTIGGGSTAHRFIYGTLGDTSSFSIFRFSTNASPAVVALGKAKSSAIGTFTAVASGDALGVIRFLGADGTDGDTQCARIDAVVTGAVSSNRIPSDLVFNTAPGTSDDSLTEAWRMTSTGILQAPGAQTIRTSTGTLTLATNGGNGDVTITPNGTGRFRYGTFSALGAEVLVGSIAMKDAGGTTRKIAIIA